VNLRKQVTYERQRSYANNIAEQRKFERMQAAAIQDFGLLEGNCYKLTEERMILCSWREKNYVISSYEKHIKEHVFLL